MSEQIKKKRVKTVFSSNLSLCHEWAHNTDPSRYAKTTNMFMEGNEIYSYGHHFLAAKIYTKQGTRFALVNSYKYSISTARHINDIEKSLDGLMFHIRVPNPANPKDQANIDYLVNNLKSVIDGYLKQRINRWDENGNNAGHYLNEQQGLLNEFCLLVGRVAPILVDEFILEAVTSHLRDIYISKEEMKERKRAKQAKALEEATVVFRQNGIVRNVLHLLPNKMLYVDTVNSVVKTSGRAEVPLNEAIGLYHILTTNGNRVVGKAIGSFKIDSVKDGILKAGCHQITLEEIENTIGAFVKARS